MLWCSPVPQLWSSTTLYQGQSSHRPATRSQCHNQDKFMLIQIMNPMEAITCFSDSKKSNNFVNNKAIDKKSK